MKLEDLPKEIKEQLESDIEIFGNGYAEKVKGKWIRLDPEKVIIKFDKKGNILSYTVKED